VLSFCAGAAPRRSTSSLADAASMSARIKSRLLPLGLSAAIAPIVITSGYLYASRRLTRTFSSMGDYSALAVAVVVGVAFMYPFAKNWPWSSRSIARLTSVIGLYIVVVTAFLVAYSLSFVCGFFDYCL
jgi:hypothetical protein